MNSSYVKSAVAQEIVDLMPPLICKTLLEHSKFCEVYELGADAVISFHDVGVSVERSALFNAVRNVLTGETGVNIVDITGRKWVLSYSSKEGEQPRLGLSYDNLHLSLPDLRALSSDQTIRLRVLQESTSEVNLPTTSYNQWYSILSKRSLDDAEVDAFRRDTLDTPVVQAQIIRTQLLEGYTNLPSLVPPSRRYFERLVGKYDGSSTIWDYATNCIGALFNQLTMWRAYDGFLFSLFLASHFSIAAEIKVDQLDQDAFVSAFDFLVKHGDRISQLGAIEVGLRMLSARPEIEPFLISLIEQILADVIDEPQSGFKLLSALFMLVDGELSRLRLFSAEPPFYRRLAALSQASLIHRQLLDSPADIQHFSEWAFQSRTTQYYIQSLVDMRLEPRWDPVFAVPAQLKAEFLGRIIIAAKNHEHSIKESKSFALILSIASQNLQSHNNFINTYLPGPLEGSEGAGYVLPSEIAESIKAQLDTKDAEISSLFSLVNFALIFRLSAEHAEKAAQVLKRNNYQLLSALEDKLQFLMLLNGLAIVAAVTRSRLLADELRIFSRKYRHGSRLALTIEEILQCCLIAAASCADQKDWREFVGDWITELAFGDLDDNDGQWLYWHLQYLFQIAPELWFTCGRADAALLAFTAI